MFPASYVVAALMAALLAGAASPVGEEVERVVAVVRGPVASEATVITLTRVEEETRIALVSRGASLAATRPLDGPALDAGLEWIIDQTLLSEEASRLQVFDIDRADSAAELGRFKARFERRADYQAFLARCDVSEPELETVLRRMLRVKRYVESRVSHAAQVSEADVTAWIDSHPAQPRDREAVRARLAEERTTVEVKALVRDLRARAEVRLFAGAQLQGQPLPPRGAN